MRLNYLTDVISVAFFSVGFSIGSFGILFTLLLLILRNYRNKSITTRTYVCIEQKPYKLW